MQPRPTKRFPFKPLHKEVYDRIVSLRVERGCRAQDAHEIIAKELGKSVGAIERLQQRYVQWAKQEGIELVQPQRIKREKKPKPPKKPRVEVYRDAMDFLVDAMVPSGTVEGEISEFELFDNFVFQFGEAKDFEKEDRIAEVKQILEGAPLWVRWDVQRFFNDEPLPEETITVLRKLMSLRTV